MADRCDCSARRRELLATTRLRGAANETRSRSSIHLTQGSQAPPAVASVWHAVASIAVASRRISLRGTRRDWVASRRHSAADAASFCRNGHHHTPHHEAQWRWRQDVSCVRYAAAPGPRSDASATCQRDDRDCGNVGLARSSGVECHAVYSDAAARVGIGRKVWCGGNVGSSMSRCPSSEFDKW